MLPGLVNALAHAPNWTPLRISSLIQGWWDAETQTPSDGSSLNPWMDRSGLGRNLTKTAGAGIGMPTMKFNQINGRKAVEFTGTGGGAPTSNTGHTGYDIPSVVATGLTQGSVTAVIQRKDDPAGSGGLVGHFIFGLTSESNIASHFPFTDGNIYDNFGTSVRKTVGNPTPTLMSPRIYSAHSATNDYRAYLDGTNLFSTATNIVGFSGTAPKWVGRSTSGSFWYGFHGYIGELIVFNDVLSTANRQLVEGYLAWKWGLQSQLPVGHPWRSNPP